MEKSLKALIQQYGVMSSTCISKLKKEEPLSIFKFSELQINEEKSEEIREMSNYTSPQYGHKFLNLQYFLSTSPVHFEIKFSISIS